VSIAARGSLTLALAVVLACAAQAQAPLAIDASAPVPAPEQGYLHMGSARAPNGSVIGVNNQYLTRNGQPWLPVMGEFHYSRSPAASWETELRKMKAAGVDIVASYVIWNHHEERDGQFDWRGQRDLRRFVQLAGKVGLDVVVRVGPWAHAEARYGGIPDWVVNAMPTRSNDPQYLRQVERLYDQIGKQLRGQLWKQGGPVIGVQLENEYNLRGAGMGDAHIATLKKLALKAGLDVPLYTVTGWDGALYPSGEVTPVFGGYPDAPWANGVTELPPRETYAFRFDSRVSGDLGAQTKAHGPGSADADASHVPFLGAEYGAGLPAMYRRRTLVSSDDIASMLPVQLGSGVNLMGYYMFHGGRNPVGHTTLEESTQSGGYNDTPIISYDFNAPLGPDGQQRPVLAALRPYHYFLRDFGAELAPMTVRQPARVPANNADLATPRWSVRSKGESGFVFYNGHVRQHPMTAQTGVQFALTLPGGTLTFPREGIDLVAGSYFIWPFNLDLDGTRLVYASAQAVARIDAGKDGIVYVFGASAGVAPEFAFDDAGAACVQAPGAHVTQAGALSVVDQLTPGTSAALTLRCEGKRTVTLLVLTPAQVAQLTIGELAGQRRLVLSEQESWFDNGRLQLRSPGQPKFRVAVYPPLARAPAATHALARAGDDGLFQVFESTLPERIVTATVTPLREARTAPPIAIGGHGKAAMQPIPEAFKTAGAWTVALSQGRDGAQYGDLLDIDFTGDIGRLFDGTRMVDDWYYNGQRWQVGLGKDGIGAGKGLTLTVLPLRADAPIYLPREYRPDFAGQAQIARVNSVRVIPVYRLTLGK
jgi:beta-galactosidase